MLYSCCFEKRVHIFMVSDFCIYFLHLSDNILDPAHFWLDHQMLELGACLDLVNSLVLILEKEIILQRDWLCPRAQGPRVELSPYLYILESFENSCQPFFGLYNYLPASVTLFCGTHLASEYLLTIP
jgi:hypothetical protein